MTISIDDRLPDGQLMFLGDGGPEEVSVQDLVAGRNVAIFAVPGAYTPTCSDAHMPSFVRSADALRSRGLEEIICISVNDPFVLKAWSAATGAGEAGIKVLADVDGSYTRSLGLNFSSPPHGLLNRSLRYSMQVKDGIVRRLNVEDNPGSCGISAGETLLDQI